MMNGNYPIRKGKCGEEQKRSFTFHELSPPFRLPFRRKGKCGEEQRKGFTRFMSNRLAFGPLFAGTENATASLK